MPDTMFAGLTSTLYFTLDNTASVLAANGITFIDNLPFGVFVANPPHAVYNLHRRHAGRCGWLPDVITYSGGNVGAGASCSLQVDVSSEVPGAHVNTTGNLISSSGDSGMANDTLTVTPVADLAIAKYAMPDQVLAGAALTYTLIISNSGPNACSRRCRH